MPMLFFFLFLLWNIISVFYPADQLTGSLFLCQLTFYSILCFPGQEVRLEDHRRVWLQTTSLCLWNPLAYPKKVPFNFSLLQRAVLLCTSNFLCWQSSENRKKNVCAKGYMEEKRLRFGFEDETVWILGYLTFLHLKVFFILYIYINLHWSIVVLQCINFCCTAQ